MDGLLIVDKPAGPTSHDVVARIRRALQEQRIGHTGTLDPIATGILVLVIGKATRLAKFLSACDKSYEAVIRFGFATDTADAQGRPIAPPRLGATPTRDEIDSALDAFRGTFMQQPPAFSAKKINGERSYKLARDARLKPSRDEAVADVPFSPALPARPALPGPPTLPVPVSVTTQGVEILAVDADTVTLRVHCSTGFYIRSLAHDLGERLGVGAHLTALRRTRVGPFGLEQAVTLDAAEREGAVTAAAMVPLTDVLPTLPAVTLTEDGANRAGRGQDIRPGDQLPSRSHQPSAMVHQPSAISHQPSFVRLVNARGDLLAIAERVGAGLLHPSVVLV